MPEERLDRLIRTLYAVGGAALAVSAGIFLRSESLELGADLVAALQLAWIAFFYALAAGATAQFLSLFEGPSTARRRLREILGVTGFLALLAGLVLLAWVSVVALADANADEGVPERQTSAAWPGAPGFGNITKCCRSATASWKRRSGSSRKAGRTS